MRNLKKRLARLEKQGPKEPVIIRTWLKGDNNEITQVESAGDIWFRGESESIEAFLKRVVAEMRSLGSHPRIGTAS